MDPSMADATMEEWETKIEDQEVQIKINADTKELDNLSKSMTRLQTDASNTQTDMSNKAAFNQKVNKNDYDALIKNGDAQIKNYDEQIAHYKSLQKTLKENNIDAESTEQWKQYQDNIDAAQQSIENMKASDTFLSDDGSFTINGLTNIALENQSIQANQRKIADWKQELAELQKAYNNHYITEEDFISQSESKNTSDIAALQGLVGEGYEAIPSEKIKALFTKVTE